jgi:hypothetical protein
MPTAEADITTEHAARYLVRLCGHAGKMGTADRRLGRRPPARADGETVRCGLAVTSGSIGTPILFLVDERAATAYAAPIGSASPHCLASSPQTEVAAAW